MSTNQIASMTLKPGYLVSLHVYIRGGVDYQTEDHSTETPDQRRKVERWKTTKRVADVTEHERALDVRGKVRSLIASECNASAFGLLFYGDKSVLDEAVAKADALRKDFNADSVHSKVELNYLIGRIMGDEAAAIASIRQQTAGLLQQLQEATTKGDVESIRKVATTLTATKKMIQSDRIDNADGKLQDAIEAARKVAREVTKRVENGRETLESVLRYNNTRAIAVARFAFDEPTDAEKMAGALPQVSLARFDDESKPQG